MFPPLHAPQAAVAGEALIDLIRRDDGSYQPCLGGALYNLARALACQGVATQYLNPLSRDRFGRALAQQLEADGVHLARSEPVQQVTSLAVVNLDAEGHPDYAFYREGVADRAVKAEGLQQDCAAVESSLRLVCTGALALDARDAGVYLPWLRAQRDAGRCVVVDANLRPSVMPDLVAYRANVHAALALADMIKVSDEDLKHLQVPGDTALEQARRLLADCSRAQLLALTMGAEGAWLLHRSGYACFFQEAGVLQVVDTVGAGDSFLAGLLAYLLSLCLAEGTAGSYRNVVSMLSQLQSTQAQDALRHAVACASLCVQRQGCVPPSWSQAAAWAQASPVTADWIVSV